LKNINTKVSQKNYATEPIAQLLDELGTTPTGLTQIQAVRGQARFGPNTIHHSEQKSQVKAFLKNFISLMAILLWISGLIAILTGSVELGIAIWLVNIINGIFSFWQEHKAAKATD